MRIGIVGGLDRNEPRYEELARRAGHHLECHNGDLAGRGAHSLGALIERSDLVVVVTDVNSHGAVWQVRRMTKQRGKRCFLTNRMGTSRFSALLTQLGT